ncbi:uncharacterized protein L201_006138 [Kwoniella dendrophila CBS 6074]|uniref:DAGKc domain-containing protein n=1 Tax=Kwoniella dendrophila CBS 6074 TaxID=1295534 RepID=A0AAX4K0D2_9TREE
MSGNTDILHIIVNPVAGHGKASEFTDGTIVPILQHLSIPYQIHTTSSPGNAGMIGRNIISKQNTNVYKVAIVGGDGTFHEFIEGVNELQGIRWEVILLPFGTANALFSSLFPPLSSSENSSRISTYQSIFDKLPTKLDEENQYQLSSLLSYLSKSSPICLPITQTVLSSSSANANNNGEDNGENILSHVVLSTSLHASILNDSEALRSTHPGVERFKIAAKQNSSKLFHANVSLHPSNNDEIVEQWDPRESKWVKPFTSINNDNASSPKEIKNAININGPFSYFLSTSSVDRLEPSFVISPLTSLRQKQEDNDNQHIYVTIIRPLRDPLITSAKTEDRKEKTSNRAFEVIGNAYSNGNHVNLTYPAYKFSKNEENKTDDEAEGEKYSLEVKGEGEPVVEVYRCSSFEWIPVDIADNDKKENEGLDIGNSNLVCADGAIHSIPADGTARVRLEDRKEGQGFYVYA